MARSSEQSNASMNRTTTPTEISPQYAGDSKTADSRSRWRWPSVLVGLLLLLFALFIYFQFTSVTGSELNAKSWEYRSFSFRRDPFTNYQLTGRSYDPPARSSIWAAVPGQLFGKPDIAIAKHLNNNPNMVDRWDLVSIDNEVNSSGDAKILVDLLDARAADYSEYWPIWSTDHPLQAAELWPAAHHLVELNLYVKLPKLLSIVPRNLSDADFATAVEVTMIEILEEFAANRIQANDNKAALKAANISEWYGQSPELRGVLNSLSN